jgi:drug/metabolite transporter (DMT)-like permease
LNGVTPPSAATSRYLALGALAAAGGAMLFASKGIIAKFLYARGVTFDALVIARALIALPLFWGFALARESGRAIGATPPRAMLAAAFAGVLCYYFGALIDFYALTLIDASVERVLLFSYPAMVVVLVAALRRRLPHPTIVVAVLATWVGIFLAVGGWQAPLLRTNLVGALCVLISAATYAIYFLLGERFTREIGSARFTLFAMSAATIALVAHGIVVPQRAPMAGFDATTWSLLALLGVFCMFVPALLQAEGVRRLGAQRGAIVSTVGPPTTIALAWAFFGERLTAGQWLGVVLIVGGILALDLRRRA